MAHVLDLPDTRHLVRELRRLPGRTNELVIGPTLKSGARDIVSAAKPLVPVVTGNLKNSLDIGRPDLQSRSIEYGARPPHSRRLHLTLYGFTHYISGRRGRSIDFYGMAVDGRESKILDVMQRTAIRRLNKINRELSGSFRSLSSRIKARITAT